MKHNSCFSGRARGNALKFSKGLNRALSIGIITAMMLSALVVFEPEIGKLNIPNVVENAAATPYTELFEDADSVPPPIMPIGWDNTQIGFPDGYFGTHGNTWQTYSGDFYSAPNCFFSGYEQLGQNMGIDFGGVFLPLISPIIDLQNASSAELTFWHKYNFIPTPWGPGPNGGFGEGYGDGGMVFVTMDGGATWDWIEPEGNYPGWVGGEATWTMGMSTYGNNPWEPLIEPPFDQEEGGGAYDGNSLDWVEATFDLTEYVGQNILIAFGYTQNYALQDVDFNMDNLGDSVIPWLIDDITVIKDTIDGPKIVVIGSDSQVVEQGQTYSYVLEITNWKNVADWIDLNFLSTQGWTVELLNYTTYAPLTDMGGIAGLVDLGHWLGPNEWELIRLNITVPLGMGWAIEEITHVTATSFTDPFKSSSEELFTSTPDPDVGIEFITVPPERPPSQPIQVTARIMNYGDFPRTFQVRCEVEGSVLIQPKVYNETDDENEYNWVVNLGSGAFIDKDWEFTPTIESPYTVTITTLLSIDQYEPNNSSSGICYVQLMDWEDHMDDQWNGYPEFPDSDARLGLWTTFDNGAGTTWQIGAPTVGPLGSYDGSDCWGTNLWADYTDDAQVLLHTPFFNFSTANTVTTTFYKWHELSDGNPTHEDYAYFGYNEDPVAPGSITILDTYVGNSIDDPLAEPSGWVKVTWDVSTWAAGNPEIRFTWALEERGNFVTAPGYYIDNVTIRASRPGALLKITEFQDNDSFGDEYIEVYNTGDAPADLADYNITIDDGASWVVGTWIDETMDGILDPGEYAYFIVNQGVNPDSLGDEGGSILLINWTVKEQYIHDEVEYGQKGVIPDPITGESVCRWWDGSRYTDDWARETNPSIGYPHTGNETVYNPLVVLNEVYFNPSTGERFIELTYAGKSGDPDVDVAGWVVIVDGIPYTIPAGPWSTILNQTNKLYVINETMANNTGSEIFTLMDASGDNVYLYNSTDSLADLVGWSDPHLPGTSIARVPDANGVTIDFERYAVDGYDDPTSIEAGWSFIDNPTMGIVIIETDQKKVGDIGDTVTYNMTVFNHAYTDIIDLYNQTLGEGWVIEILDKDGLPLSDNNGNGIPDTGILTPNEVIEIKVRIYIPLSHPGNNMTIIINAVPGSNQDGSDEAVLITETYPHVEIQKSATPLSGIWVNGSGPSYTPQETTITLTVWGAGMTQFIRYPQDIVFCIDSSASMNNNDPFGRALEAAKNYVDNMTTPDRAAVVNFNDYSYLVDGQAGDPGNNDPNPFDSPPRVVPNLSNDYEAIKANIDECAAVPNGWTAIGASLENAVLQLQSRGLKDHVQAIILLTDGLAWDPTLAVAQAEICIQEGIRIYTIQLDVFDQLNNFFLEYLAEKTGGSFYETADADTLSDIYSQIGEELSEIAGRDLVIEDENYMIQDVLPPYIRYVPGTFTVMPDNISENQTGYTLLKWQKQYITIGEYWQVSFKIVSNRVGYIETNVYQDSRINYTKWDNENVTSYFPHSWINVKSPMPLPPLLRIDLAPGGGETGNIILDWDPPIYPDIDHYLIYMAPTRTGFDFSTPWVNTTDPILGEDPVDGLVIDTRTTWNDTSASLDQERYYVIRTVTSQGKISMTSNTVGKYTKSLPSGVSTFSLPLEPCYPHNVSYYINHIGSDPTDYIKWMNSTHQYVKHNYPGQDNVNDAEVVVGDGYEIGLLVAKDYTFCGMPASSIRYMEGGLPAPTNFDISLDFPGQITLSWDEVIGADRYLIYRASSREGLNEVGLNYLAEQVATPGVNTHTTSISLGEEYYYIVGALDPTGTVAYNTTYAIGVWYAEYDAGYDTIAQPMQPFVTKDLYTLCYEIPDTWGMNYYDTTEQRWVWHKTIMPDDIYDSPLTYTEGFWISTQAQTEATFIGR